MKNDSKNIDLSRGSTWRKWDLHVHCPSKYTCAKRDDFLGNSLKEKQEKFIEELSMVKDCAVIGITDYFSLDGYEYVISHKDKLPNIDLILPNIELRITPETNKGKKINLHIIPNLEKLTIDKVKRFLCKFEFGTEKFTCRYKDLIKFGRKNEKKLISEEEAFKKGLNSFHITYQKFFEVFNEENEEFKNNILIGVANGCGDGTSGIKDLPEVRYIIYEAVNFIFSSNSSDIDYFLGNGSDTKEEIIQKYGNLKPCVHGSDYHGNKTTNKEICKPDLNRFCWIKADPTFEGLKQIVYEPKERVRIQANIPDDKTGYYVIDRIEIDHENISNKEILLNENLNTIIGGRSTGKSILLAAIATKLKLENEPVFKGQDKEKYKKYIDEIKNTIKIFWKDGKEEDNREVEYFQQGYMYELSNNKDKLNTVIQDILKKKGKETIFEEYKSFISLKSKEIETDIGNLFQVIRDIKENKLKLLDKGDKNGVESEIKKLEVEKQKNSTIQIKENEKIEYETLKKELENIQSEKKKNTFDIQLLANISVESFIKDSIDYELLSISNDTIKTNLKEYFSKLRNKFIELWGKKISEIKTEIQTRNEGIEKREKEIEENSAYKKVNSAFKESEQIQEIEKKLQIEKIKLGEIEILNKKISELTEQSKNIKKKILENYNKFSSQTNEVIKKLSLQKDGLEILAKESINEKKYKDLLGSALHNSVTENRTYLPSNLDKILNIFDDLLEGKLQLKGGYTHENLAKNLLTKNYHEIQYELIYENDSFGQMSDGKKAFVVSPPPYTKIEFYKKITT